MKYKYRIKQKSEQNFIVEFKPAGLIGLFFSWNYLQRHFSLSDARASCKRQLTTDKTVFINKIIEVFSP